MLVICSLYVCSDTAKISLQRGVGTEQHRKSRTTCTRIVLVCDKGVAKSAIHSLRNSNLFVLIFILSCFIMSEDNTFGRKSYWCISFPSFINLNFVYVRMRRKGEFKIRSKLTFFLFWMLKKKKPSIPS